MKPHPKRKATVIRLTPATLKRVDRHIDRVRFRSRNHFFELAVCYYLDQLEGDPERAAAAIGITEKQFDALSRLARRAAKAETAGT